MRILHITSQYPGKTGSGTYLQAMIAEAHKKNFTQGLLGATQTHMNYDNKNLEFIDMVRFQSNDLPFGIMGMSDKMPYPSSTYKDMTPEDIGRWEGQFTAQLENALDEFKPDVILSHHLWLATSIVARLSTGVPVFAICHGTDIRQFIKVPWLGEKVRDGAVNLKGVFALTIEQKNIIQKLYQIPADKIHLAGGGYNEEVFYPANYRKSSEKTRLVYAGKLSHAKGIIPLFDVFEDLSKDHSLELVMAGSGDGIEKEEIIGRGASLGVVFAGMLNQKELAELFRDSHIFVLPSYYEGLPLVTMEALACGLRVVTTDIPGLRNYLGDEISSSGLVEFVELPEMIDVDTPLEEEYQEFVVELKKRLLKQIENTNDGYNCFAPLKSEIEKLSWQGVFQRISKQF